MLYAAASSSDSVAYYNVSSTTTDWLSVFGTGTTFIHFLAWPFTGLMGLSYYATMIIFSFFGFASILLFYITARENIALPANWRNYSYLEIVFLLPNLHFWSASLGKGSVIMLGLALFIFGLSRYNRRMSALLIGGGITFMVRPHILLAAIVSVMIGVLLTNSGIKNYLRWLIFVAAAVVFFFISDDVVKFADTDGLNVLTSSSLSHRASELGKATSGVNIQEYGLLMKLFTFWFRPLFVDSGGAVGLIASFENMFYLVMFLIIIREGILHWTDWNGWFRICLFFFLFASLALAQVTGNLGVAMRQKAQVMPFFFIIFCKAFSYRNRVSDEYAVEPATTF